MVETSNEQEDMQEKVKDMSPEELKEFQKKNCIFCQIISGKVNSKKVYEDEKVCAILDINPANPGHMLLMPKEHYSILPQIPEDVLEHIFLVTKALSNAALKVLKVEGTTIFVANGVTAGQKAQHFMLHIIPRKENDNIGFSIPKKTISEPNQIEVQKRLSEKLKEVFKGKKVKICEGLAETKVEKKETKKEEKPAKEKSKKEKPKKTKKVTKKRSVNLDDISKLLGK